MLVQGQKSNYVSVLAATYPVLWIQIQVLDFPVVEVTRQSHAIVRQMCLFADDHDVILAASRIEFQDLFSTQTIRTSSEMGGDMMLT
jgi:hypothetical protein